MQKLKIIVGGFIGVMPAGGVTWDYVQYPVGFKALGHDVYYIEDTKLYPIYQKTGSDYTDASSCVKHLETVMKYFGFEDHWAYRDEASGKCFGMTEEKIKEVCATADVFVNISCSTFLRDEYLKIPARVLIDSDPMFTQIQYLSQQMFTPGEPGLRQMIDAHNYHFTFGENINSDDCRIPNCGLNWKNTRQPVCLEYWKPKNGFDINRSSFTTVMNWSAAKVLNYQDEEWGQKDIEFNRFLKIPNLITSATFSAVINKPGGTEQFFSKQEIERAGWEVLDPAEIAGDWSVYRHFIDQSYAEFSVAKHTYVKARTGWFSCRSACYLAMGKPVVTQDTGWSKIIPSGEGVFAFDDMTSATGAIEKINKEYKQQSLFAKAIANEYFDSTKVLSQLLAQL
ncbi:MAG: glycosyltransferase family 1 protein [Flavisolibacter sp.]|nr:glycosyltransferase family 1 protein [Flavisolibacter sp.]